MHQDIRLRRVLHGSHHDARRVFCPTLRAVRPYITMNLTLHDALVLREARTGIHVSTNLDIHKIYKCPRNSAIFWCEDRWRILHGGHLSSSFEVISAF